MNAELQFTRDEATPILTMAEIIQRIRENEDHSETRCRNLSCSVRVMCRALGQPPDSLPASFELLRGRLAAFHPLSAGIRPKRWQNIRSDVSFALRHFGPVPPVTRRAPLPTHPEWQCFRKAIGDHEHLSWKLSRLARYCSERGTTPSEVNDAVMAEYAEMVRGRTFKTNPAVHYRDVSVYWNKCADACSHLGLSKVTLPSRLTRLTPDQSDLNPAFRNEAEAWLLHQSTEGDILDETAPSKPLRPSSVNTYRYIIRRAVAGLVASGTPIEQIESLRQLVEPGAAKAILKHHLARTGDERNSMVAGIANVLVRIAITASDLDEASINQLRTYRSRVMPRQRGLSARPKAALRQFAEPANIERLLVLPIRVFHHTRNQSHLTRKHLLDMQAAVALELLLMRPIRRNNLVSLRIGTNLHAVGTGFTISIPGETVKNGDDLDYPIPAESARLMRFYIDTILPQVGPNPDGWLFPGQGPLGHKAPESLARNFQRTVREWTGLSLYVHLMRHFGASLHLEHHPGALDTVRRVLGHRSLDTTVRSYAHVRDSAAVRQFDGLVLAIRKRVETQDCHD